MSLHQRLLDMSDFDSVMSFRDFILSHLENPDFYRRESDEEAFVRCHLDNRGFTIGLFEKSTLIGIGCLTFAEYGNTDLLGHVSDITPSSAVWLSATMVHPRHRGQGLQNRLIESRISEARRRGRRGLIATVSPENHYSWSNLLVHKLFVCAVMKAYGAHDRFVMFGVTTEPVKFDCKSSTILNPRDIRAQQRLIQAGYVGVRSCRRPNGDVWIEYLQPLHVNPHTIEWRSRVSGSLRSTAGRSDK